MDVSWAVSGTGETRNNMISSIFLDFDQLERFNYDLQEKYARIQKNAEDFEGYRLDDAEIVLVSYGISSRISRSAVDVARKNGLNVGLLRPRKLWPFPVTKLQELAARDTVRFLSVEMSNGQMADDIRLAVNCSRPVELVNRMGGNLICLEDVIRKIHDMVG
jgi:2-oxoisovalerate ferredoxin oxidoreductase alpha subunit